MTEIIIAVTIIICIAIIAVAAVAGLKVFVAYKTAKLTLGANAVMAKLHEIKKSYQYYEPKIDGSYPDSRDKTYFRQGYETGFEEARNLMFGVAMSAKEDEE
jgi:uncharacterized membrane protein